MNSRSILPLATLLFACVIISVPSLLHGQAQSGRGNFTYAGEKPVVSYYEELDDKSFYHQRRIHGMKGELNNYSEKLHNLQQRFDQIFYGLASRNSFKTPFDVSNQPTRPDRRTAFEANASSVPFAGAQARPRPQANNTFRPPQSVETGNQLAFNVNSPGQYTQDKQVVGAFSPRSSGGGGLGGYLIISPGVSFPHKVHKTTESYRKYDPGFAVSLAGGMKKDGFRFGLGTSYKRNSFHETAKDETTLLPLSEESETFAGYLDLGYEFRLVGALDGYIGAGLGYYFSRIEDPLSRNDDGFFATGAIGLAYNFSQLFALRLGYRYHHEEEVPAHLAELGLDFEF
jgi:opacity protein-like surface antigen